MRNLWLHLLIAANAIFLFAQAPASNAHSPVKPAEPPSASQAIIPERVLHFSAVDSDPTIALSPVTSVPVCSPDGTLFLDMLNPKDLTQHSVVAIKGKVSRSYSPAAITDLRDTSFYTFYPTENGVTFLVRGTRETTSSQGAGRSPAGFPWKSYHTYIAQFKGDGTYHGSIEIPVSYRIQRFASLPSGEFLVAGYDETNSAAKLLLLDDSGRVLRTLDTPLARSTEGVDAPFRSVEAARVETNLIGSIVFTPYNQDVLMWRRNSADPILEIGAGGSLREVPLQVPAGFVFVEMVPAKDRWIARFRKQQTPEDAPFTREGYAYFELRSQDASPSAKLAIADNAPQSIACEADQAYMSYKMDDAGKFRLYQAQ